MDATGSLIRNIVCCHVGRPGIISVPVVVVAVVVDMLIRVVNLRMDVDGAATATAAAAVVLRRRKED